MTKLEALKALAEKVESGEARPYEVEEAALDVWPNGEGVVRGWLVASSASKAYGGSLDAAKALHEAVLPEWYEYDISKYWCSVYDSSENFSARNEGDPARAWLLAILKVLISEEESA